MANGDVTVRMSAENADLVQKWLEALRGPQAFSQELDKIATKGRRAGQVTKDAFAGAGGEALRVVGALTGVGSVLAGILTVANQLKAEYEAMKARQQESADRQLNVHESYTRAVRTLSDKQLASPDQFFERTVRGANGVDPKDLFLTFEAGVSASGNLSPEEVLETVLASTKLAPEMTLNRRQALVTGALQLKKGFPGATAEQALAGTYQSFIAARTEDVEEFSKYMAPGIAQMAAFGSDKDSYEYLASMAIAIGQRSGDATGRRSMNATINMLKQVRKETLAAGLAGPDASVEEQMEAVRNSPDLRRKMLGVFARDLLGDDWEKELAEIKLHKGKMGGELKGETKSFMALTEILSPGENKTKEEEAAARSKLLGLSDAAVAKIEEQNRAGAGSTSGVTGQLARIKRQQESELLLLSPEGQTAELREVLKGMLKYSGAPSIEQWGQDLYQSSFENEEVTPATLSRAENRVRVRARYLRHVDEEGNPIDAPGTPSKADLKAAEALERTADRIEELIRLLQPDRVQKVSLQTDGAGQPMRDGAAGINDWPGFGGGAPGGGASGGW